MQIDAEPQRPLLEVDNISMRFGGILALDKVCFTANAGNIIGLIGPNGAGKTTLFNCVSRLYPYTGGEIRFNGSPLSRSNRSRMAALGIGRTFQNLALFKSMNVRQNVMAGANSQGTCGFLANGLSLPRARKEERRITEHADELLEHLSLTQVAGKRPDDLPFGTLKRVEMARALACSPKLLLLDEPACGLNHEEVEELGDLIRSIRTKMALTILLVEHHMRLLMKVSDRVVVLNFGQKIADGSPKDVQNNSAVIDAYLGAAH